MSTTIENFNSFLMIDIKSSSTSKINITCIIVGNPKRN